jgi:hypothetical protein
MNAVPGGHFPLPSEVAYLMSRTPPPQCFNVRFLPPPINQQSDALLSEYKSQLLTFTKVHTKVLILYTNIFRVLLST